MREINTSTSPKISLTRKPPHSANKNIFSDLANEILIKPKPRTKLIAEMEKPMIIEINKT
jgi:hypothetical protein